LAVIHKAKDNSVKTILAEPELFAEFLRNFIPIDILKDIAPADIEDISERLISLVSEQKDGDTIKRINLNNEKSIFVITIVEHESKVNYRASFKMLLYIAGCATNLWKNKRFDTKREMSHPNRQKS